MNFVTVKMAIKCLPRKRSEDHDGFLFAILKEEGIMLLPQLPCLFNMSLSLGSLPDGCSFKIPCDFCALLGIADCVGIFRFCR